MKELTYKDTTRFSSHYGINEETNLQYGYDFRLPVYRREVFKRFYHFHNVYLSHPGFVYAAFPFLKKELNWNKEQLLWACFLNGVCQNIVTTQTLMEVFPTLPQSKEEVVEIHNYVMNNWQQLEWDMDRKYTKSKMGKIVESYLQNLNGLNQETFFNDHTIHENKFANFRCLWDKVFNDFFLFGRLSTFSYLEYLRIAGIDIDCDSLFLEDMNGSKSHRNGLCKVLGRDDIDWHDKLNPNFLGDYSHVLEWLKTEGQVLLEEYKKEYPNDDASYFTLESTLCCYKSWFRKDRRYPGVYLDMHFKRIKRAEEKWAGKKKFDLQWEMRKTNLPEYLRVENNPNDPTHNETGLSKEKQNHFRLTGQPIMMDLLWPCFKNDFNEKYYHNSTGLMSFYG
jgi:hypothetical protein